MIPSQTMIASAVDPAKRGAFLSFSSSVQQLSTAAASVIAGLIVTKNEAGQLLNFQYVGYFAALMCVLSVFVARKVKAVS